MAVHSKMISILAALFIVACGTCELASAGEIVAWGWNRDGQCNVPDGNDFVDIGAGAHHSVALKSDGSLVAWGDPREGRCAVPDGSDFTAFAVGDEHNLALRFDGSIVGWGQNYYGQTDVPDGNDFVAIAAGARHSLALRSDGSIVGWGENNASQINVPEGNDFVAIAAGSFHSLALRSDGSIVGWGSNGNGQIDVPEGNDFVAIAGGGAFSLALKSDGSIVGLPDYPGRHPNSAPGGKGFMAIAAGYGHGIALRSEGSLVGWTGGHNEYHQATVPFGNNFVSIAAGSHHNLALVVKPINSAPVACIAGGNRTVQAADDGEATVTLDGSCSKDDDSTPGTNDDIVSFDWYEGESLLGSGEIIDCNMALGTHAVALAVTDAYGESRTRTVTITIQDGPVAAVSGHIAAWGSNEQGQCEAPPGDDFVAVAAGAGHSIALRSDGSLVAWGDNRSLAAWGDNQYDVPAGNDFVAISAGALHNLALRSNGSLVAWGTTRNGVTSVPWGYDFVAIAAGGAHSVALKADGSLLAWGSNDGGQLEVPDGNDFVAIAAGATLSLALRADGSVTYWGEKGRLPEMPDGNDFVAIGAGGDHGVLLRADSSVVYWAAVGGNPVPPPGYGFTAIASGDNFCLGLKCTGEVVGWNMNQWGQIDVPTWVDPYGIKFIAIAGGHRHSLGIFEYPLSAELTGEQQVDLLWPTPIAREPKDWYVSPTGSPCSDGSEEDPWDLPTAFCRHLIRPGDTIWLAGGTYHGPFVKYVSPSGTEEAPIVYRAKPGERVTLTADKLAGSVLHNTASYVWFWGLEVTMDGAPELGYYAAAAVTSEPVPGVKYINMVVHDCPNRSGFIGGAMGSEYYGCMSYRNGLWAHGLGHGFYLQNRPRDVGGLVEALPWLKCLDCLAFSNYCQGIQGYATSPRMANMLYEGVAAWGNSLPEGSEKQGKNFLAGGRQHDDNFIIRNCFTYFPGEAAGKVDNGANFGYTSATNGSLVVEGNIFVGGNPSVGMNGWEQITFQRNTCYNAVTEPLQLETMGSVTQYSFDNNTYYQGGRHLTRFILSGEDHYYDTIEDWQAATGWDLSSIYAVGEPKDAWVFVRPNKYEPERAHLIVYNWPKTDTVTVEMANLWPEDGQEYTYHIVNVEDIWASPDVEGPLTNGTIEVPMTGTYAPEFACYLVTRSIP